MVRAIDTDHRLTFEEYLEFEDTSETRHELVDGHLYAFAGASARHNLIAGDVFGLFRSASRETHCQVFTHAMRLRVSSRVTYYPDIMVTCDPDDNHEQYRSKPCLIVEVLSPSTMLIDRREKLIAYQGIDSLRGYMMVYRDDHRVESYTRNDDGIWVYANLTGEQDIWFPCVNLTLPVHALYEDVDMSPIVPSVDEPDIR